MDDSRLMSTVMPRSWAAIEPVIKRLWPFFWSLCVGLFIVAFVSQLSLWLPTALGLIAVAS